MSQAHARAIDEAAAALVAGELVAFPTETVYGLGARADDDAAVARIFQAKGRPAAHPLIVHVADAASAAWFGNLGVPDSAAQRLIGAFWPGPLTVIVRATPAAPRLRPVGRTASVCVCPPIRWRGPG